MSVLIYLMVFLPFVAGVTACMMGKKRGREERELTAVWCVTIELALSFLLPGLRPSARIGGILAGGLSFSVDGFRAAYGIVTAIMWFFTTIFSLEYFEDEQEHQDRYWLFVLWTLGATEGVMLSGDFMTAYVFFEILSFTSFTWVVHEETNAAIRAGCTYLYIAVIGGLVLFMGLLMLKHCAGTLVFSELPEAAGKAALSGKGGELFAAGVCILLGFGAKAGMFPLHVWLPKAHPVAPSPASALLSGILTKVGIYGILMVSIYVMVPAAGAGDVSLSLFGTRAVGIGPSFGLLVLILGTITMVLGAVLGVFSVNLKRTLACSSMSQIGFILIGIAMTVLLTSAQEAAAAETALSGTVLHMVNHSLLKLCLFMASGVFVMRLHALDLDTLRGYGRNKTWLKIAFLLGLVGISGVPCFNGYISKTLLHEGIVLGAEGLPYMAPMLRVIEWIFLASGGLTFAYMTKLFICVFVEKNTDGERQAAYDSDSHCMNIVSTVAVCGSSLFMVILGIPYIMKHLASSMTGKTGILSFEAFSFENLKGAGISLLIGAVVYLVIVRLLMIRNRSYVNLWPKGLDLENYLYRPILLVVLPDVFGAIAAIFGENMILKPLCRGIMWLCGVIVRILSEVVDGIIVLLSGTLFKEQKLRRVRFGDNSIWWSFVDGTHAATSRLSRNFSYAMLLTCIGLMLVFGALVVLSLII